MIAPKNVFKHLLLLSLVFCSLAVSSCARTVTEKQTFLQVEFTLTFATSIDPANYNYILAISSRQKPSSPNPNFETYLPLPGRLFEETILVQENQSVESGIAAAYRNTFSTWMDYYLYDDVGLHLIKSGGTGFPAETTKDLAQEIFPETDFSATAELSNGNKTLTITLLNDDFSAPATSLRYNIITTKRQGENRETGAIVDAIIPQITPVTLKANTDPQAAENLGNNINTENKPADLVSYSIEVF